MTSSWSMVSYSKCQKNSLKKYQQKLNYQYHKQSRLTLEKTAVKVLSKCWRALHRTDLPLQGDLITVYQKHLKITNAGLFDIYYKVLYWERKKRWSLLLAKTHFPCNCSALTFATKHKNTINVIYWESLLTYLFYPWTLNKDSCLPLPL